MKARYLSLLLVLFPVTLTSCGNTPFEESIPEYDLCDDVIRRFLESNNSETDYNILKNERGNYDKQYVPLELPESLYNCQIFYDEDPNFTNPMFYFPDYGEFTMCVPGKTYYYRAYNYEDEFRTSSTDYNYLKTLPEGNPIKEGKFTVKDEKVRYVNVERINNMRDLGGWSTTDGRKLKYGMLYRGPELDSLTNFAKIQLKKQLGNKSEIDLRYGISKTSCAFGANYYPFGMQQYDLILPKNVSYRNYTKTAIQNTFALLSNEENYPAVFHCAAGADRTGTLAFLIAGALGVSKEDLTKDFELTSFSEFGYRCRGKLQSPYNYGMYQNDALNYVNWGALIVAVTNSGIPGSPFKDRMRVFLNENYGITEDTINKIESIMLE